MLSTVVVLLATVSLSFAASVIYDQPNGWSNWTSSTPLCGGGRQSPIDLNPMTATTDCTMDPIWLGQHQITIGEAEVTNPGYTVSLTPQAPTNQMPVMKYGGLSDDYRLVQMHMHFAQNNTKGSEHTVLGFSYPMELHMVHQRNVDTPIGDLLAPDNDGEAAAVLGVMFEVVDKATSDTKNLQSIIDIWSAATTKDYKQTVNVPLKYTDLLPKDTSSFYRYYGSLTTPGCHEAVVWTVFTNPIQITQDQMNQMRKIQSEEADKKMQNFRLTQPLNNREVILRRGDCFTIKLTSSTSSVFLSSILIAVIAVLHSLAF